eukprot:CAMPEP_0194196354 /NCGR_PEP_ID=MMETSP0154-20130528/76620_1 /TAXON_ID=1049557 /ORGANISM="Thalassiothrix antarctica, Strain L6-D1" /LENGTH=595 /DNA_ID=CAMNT_0038920941 /DNA_START=186 /DNA_END=1974 /DNA_ORIENTATION=+
MIPLHESLQNNEKLLRSIYSSETPTKKKKATKHIMNRDELPSLSLLMMDNIATNTNERETITPDISSSSSTNNYNNSMDTPTGNNEGLAFIRRRVVKRGHSDGAVLGYYSDDEKRYRKLCSYGSEGEEEQPQQQPHRVKEEEVKPTTLRKRSIFKIPSFGSERGSYMFSQSEEEQPQQQRHQVKEEEAKPTTLRKRSIFKIPSFGSERGSYMFSQSEEEQPQQQRHQVKEEEAKPTTPRNRSIFKIPSFGSERGNYVFSPKGCYMFSPPRRRPRAKPVESPWLIPVDHPLKVFWDLATVLVSIIVAYHSHTRVRDKSFGEYDSFISILGDAWFLFDILLNFVSQIQTGGVVYKDYKSVWARYLTTGDILLNFVSQIQTGGVVYKDYKSVWARYLTTWFIVDVVSLIPWERHYVKPIVEIHKRRGIFRKIFFKGKAVVRVTTKILRKRHVQRFGKVARTTKHAGVGARRLLRLIIRYVPKYVFFYRRMKAIIVMRLLRQVHHLRKMVKILSPLSSNNSTNYNASTTNTTPTTNMSPTSESTKKARKVYSQSESYDSITVANEDTVATADCSEEEEEEEDETMSLNSRFEGDYITLY